MMKRNRLICLFLIYAIFPQFLVRTVSAQTTPTPPEEPKKGLQLRLREGVGKASKSETIEVVNAAKLSAAEADAILRRLPPMDVKSADKKDFAMREKSLPPPKTGKVIPVKFPADEQMPVPKPGNPVPLEVVRSAPKSFVSFAKDLSITFSQPMVAVTSQTNAAQTVPVELTPPVAGKWRWLGTNTLIFDAEKRFPMATKYSARVKAGTKAVAGGVLQEDYTWNFETPPPRVESFSPNEKTVRREAILLAKFNQQITPEEVLPKIYATANDRKIDLRLAEPAEISADKEISESTKKLPAGSWIAFRAVEPLPLDSAIAVKFETGIPSAEGSETSSTPFFFGFRTFGGLKMTESYCDYDENPKECRSYGNWTIEFNNPLDEQSFDKSLVEIEPKLDEPEFEIYGDRIVISGCCRQTRRTYKVKISEKLKDEFGQTLGKAVSTEFKVGADPASLYLTDRRGNDFITLDPSARRVFSVNSVNYESLKVRLFAVKPEDYETFFRYRKNEQIQPIGNPVFDKIVRVKSEPDTPAETKIDLRPALTNGLGHAVLLVEPPVLTKENEDERIFVWLQATQTGIDAFSDNEELIVYASDLKSGKPLKNVDLQIPGGSGVTNEEGLGTIKLPTVGAGKENWLIARNGADSAILRQNNNYYSSNRNWTRTENAEQLRWFVFDDRKMYRPGETVSIKGYLRKFTGGRLSDIEDLGDAAAGGLNYSLKDSLGVEVLSGKADLNVFGAFDFQIEIPARVNLGTQTLRLSTGGKLVSREFSHQFQAQEFRRPEFEVSARSESRAPFYVGDSATLSVEAKYYAGGGLANAETNWTVTTAETHYTPPNRDDYTFGKFTPWWRDDREYKAKTSEKYKGATDRDGKHYLGVDFVSVNPARPYAISAEARVADVNRQTFAAATDILVHPSELYVGLRTEKNFVVKDENIRVETITTDVDGNAVAGAPVSLVAELKDWEKIKGEWQEIIVDTQTCQLKSTNEPAACEFKAKQGGTFTITASVLDKRERRNESDLTIWVAGAKSEPAREVEREEATLIPDKEEYAPGETARILVNAPFYPAEGVMTVRRGGIVRTERFTMTEASFVLQIPVEERFLPNFHVQVDLFGAARRIVFENEMDAKLPKRPAYAGGALNLAVSVASRKLTVAAEPIEKTLEPGGETAVNVAVKDSLGNPAANAEVAVVAVDESILALTNYRIEDPLDAFYQLIEDKTANYYSRENILLASVEDLLKSEKFSAGGVNTGGTGGGYGEGSGAGMGNSTLKGSEAISFGLYDIAPEEKKRTVNPDQIRMRRNFNALAIFSPSVKTDSDGRATVKINLPDNLTRYRITAVAADGSKKFGKTESAITARQSLMVRPSAPRFLNFGDKAELPIVLQNQTDKPLTVDVALRAANANLPDGNGRRVTIAANDRAELRFPVAVEEVGTARFQVGAVSGNFADAAEFAFPVWTPSTSEAFATYGTTASSGAITQSIEAPNDVYSQFGGLEITTSSTQLQELTDAFLYLQSYPFECSEQVSSRILSVAALRDVLEAFKSKDMPSKSEIEARMYKDIERLEKLQHADGGFSFWSSKDESLPYVSTHVAHALARAKQKGYIVSPFLISGLQNYLRNIEAKMPPYYSPETRRAISAYALYVRDLMGEKDAGKARKLVKEAALENLSAESLAWILGVLAGDKTSVSEIEEIKGNLLNRVTETAAAANFVSGYKDGEYVLLASDRRTDAVILEALLNIREAAPEDRESDDLIPKIVRGLLAGKTRGRWRSTQENAFVLLALDKYFQTYERVTPNFVARVWLGETFAGEQKFEGRSVDSKTIDVPMAFLRETQGGANNLTLDKQGSGRLYYRIGLQYAPKNLNLAPADYGFAVSRRYEAVDDPLDVRQNSDNSWTIRSGARVRVRVRMIAPSRRYHVALVDNLPAGFEIINSNLAVSESLPEDEKVPVVGERYSFYDSRWYDHQNLRDNRAEVFKSLLYQGTWDYSYVARATTPGAFIASPAKAEEMYSPETFGRSHTDFVTIE